ncbi:transcription factor bHLH93-like [Malania oleifera]|uniref:transcription factor bHLH93-like n=1 Tax=Malania oleifera TaxID=397392 RepID=UPI0025AE4306|nr:transcription factor bHLH93-like [Malania oleifera]
MELNEHAFFEELLGLRRDTWETINPSAISSMSEFYSNAGSFDGFDEYPSSVLPNFSFEGFSAPLEEGLSYPLNELYCPFGDGYSAMEITDSSYNKLDTPPWPAQEDFPLSTMEDEELGQPENVLHSLEMTAACKAEPVQSTETPVFNMGYSVERKNRARKADGQPSKNLMAERRRRKRLNDRLSMLRSVVPKISKMDRTSILGDTIDYVKELLERINNLQEEARVDSEKLNLMGIFKDLNPNEILVRNSPKFDVERRNTDTRIEICCAGKPGLLLSTVNTLEALGLEVEQCVISCFNDFAMHASCSEEVDQRTVLSSEDIKQALFRNAGYGGRCL